MKNTRLFLALASFSISAFAFDSAVVAASKTSNFDVTASVAANCTISSVNINFGAYDPIAGAALTQNGSVTVACTKGASSLSIALDMGQNSGVAQGNSAPDNAMSNGTDYLKYGLYQDDGSTRWNGVSRTIPSSGRAGTTYQIIGKVAAGQDVSVGSYSDTVIATINY